MMKSAMHCVTVAVLCGLAGVLCLSTLRIDSQEAEAVEPTAEQAAGVRLAGKYPNDVGIGDDADVIFAEDFESWDAEAMVPPEGTWTRVNKRETNRISVVPGQVTRNGPGKRVLELACWQKPEGSGGAGLTKLLGNYDNANQGLGPGYEEVYVRYYQKFDKDYVPVANHGSLLGGRDLTQADARWVGMADTRDVAAQGYYSACLQPYSPGRGKPLHWGFYSYHADKPGRWGDYFEPVKMAAIEVDRWYCLEWHLKLNSVEPLRADAVEELYVDGELSIRKTDLRYRKVPQLKITFFSLGTYYHPGLPEQYTADHPIKLYYDNLVIARKPIGPVQVAR